MSTLKVNKLRDTAGSADAITLDPNGGAVLAGVTTISTARITTGITTSIQVGGGVTISESGIEASGIGITVANINGTQIGGRRNIVINGAMTVAQRGTSSTSAGYQTVDRFRTYTNGLDEEPTQAQVDVSSGTSPYTEGFRKAFKITNGDQTSIATNDYVYFTYNFESQDIACSGWNYTSSSSFITLSFWVKSSVAQEFHGYLKTNDGTAQLYSFSTGSLTADTWTKVVKTIPGNSNLQFDNDVNTGLLLRIAGYMGTYRTGSLTQDQWAAYNSSVRYPDFTNTWFDTNDATLEFTGLQLEVGPQATPFEHRPYTEEFKLCERYYQDWKDYTHGAHRGLDSNYDGHVIIDTLKIDMRANPTVTSTSYGWIADGNNWTDGSNSEAASLHNDPSSDFPGRYIKVTGVHNWDSNYNNTIAVKFVTAKFDAEL